MKRGFRNPESRLQPLHPGSKKPRDGSGSGPLAHHLSRGRSSSTCLSFTECQPCEFLTASQRFASRIRVATLQPCAYIRELSSLSPVANEIRSGILGEAVGPVRRGIALDEGAVGFFGGLLFAAVAQCDRKVQVAVRETVHADFFQMFDCLFAVSLH